MQIKVVREWTQSIRCSGRIRFRGFGMCGFRVAGAFALYLLDQTADLSDRA